MAEHERHEPEKSLLHRVVREQLEGFLANAARKEQPTPRFVEQELRAFLRCGVLAHGFLRVHCDDCGLEPDQIGRVLAGAARRIQRVIEARHADDEEALARDEPLLALLAAASLRARIATGTHLGEP